MSSWTSGRPHWTERGMAFVELLVAVTITLTITGALFMLMSPSHGVFEVQLDRADMQQRMRVAADSMFRELLVAGAGAHQPAVAPVRRGLRNPDAPGSAFADRLSIVYVPPDGLAANAEVITYWHRIDSDGVPQLMRYDGQQGDLPVADHIASLHVAYFDGGGLPLAIGSFSDGPWLPHAASPQRFDVDLLAVRKVRVTLRVQPSRQLLSGPRIYDDVVIDVAPRNLNLS